MGLSCGRSRQAVSQPETKSCAMNYKSIALSVGFYCCILLLLNVIQLRAEPLYAPVVAINTGLVRGLVVEADAGRLVNFYQGIRYGRAVRFMKPRPVEPWTGVYNATQWRFACPQPDMEPSSELETSTAESWPKISVYNEDCLFLNVWQPTEPDSPPTISKRQVVPAKPVMVWIHGGAFAYGTIFSAQYDARQIAALGDVVVVAISYRLGAFGFLYGGTRDETGNMGLYDQILALEWVQNNIGQFGGNPKQVTIFGESSGAMSVGILTLSPLTTGLFQRAILQSGSPNSLMGSELRGISMWKTRILAAKLGCAQSSPRLIVNCLRSKPASDIVQASKDDFQQINLMLPVVGDRLMPIPPVQALRQFNKRIDLVFGVVRDEGSIFVKYFFPQLPMSDDKISVNIVRAAIRVMVDRVNLGNRVSSLVTDYYASRLNQDSTPSQLRTAISDVFGDFSLVCPTLLFGEQVARRVSQLNSNQRRTESRVNHFYAYRVMSPVDSPFIACSSSTMGVCHGQDNVYIFGHPVTFDGVPPFGNFTRQQIELSRHMITAWTQFARTGIIKPVAQVPWEEVTTRPNNFSVSHFSFDSGNDESKTDQYRMIDRYWDITCGKLWKPIIFR